MPMSALEANAGEVMSSPPIVASETTTLEQAARLMIENRIGCLPVVNEMGKLTGVVTEKTFQVQIAGIRPTSSQTPDRRVLEELYIAGPDRMGALQDGFIASYSTPVSEVMLTNPPVIAREAPLWHVADTLLKTHLSHLVVAQDGKPIGIIARHDLLRAYASKQRPN